MKQFFENKIFISVMALVAIVLFQTCIRYEYHIIAKGLATVRIDKLTGKTKIIKNYNDNKKTPQNIESNLLEGFKE